MKEIQGVKLEPARNAAHYELVHSILEFAEKCQAVTENMAEALAALKAAVDHEGYLLGISLKSEHTERLEITDRERDGFVSAGKGLVNALMKNPDAAIAEAARELMTQMTSLKVDTQANYMQQTGEIDILLATLQGKYAEQIETCRIGVVFNYLKDANDRMHDLLNLRDAEQAPRSGSAMEDARRETDTAYRAFIKFYNAWIFINAAALVANDLGTTVFSTEANAKIEYFKRYVLKESGTTRPGAEETEDEELEEEIEGEGGETGGSGSNGGGTAGGSGSTGSGSTGSGSSGGSTGGSGSTGSGSNETPTDPTKILLLFNDGAHGNVIVKRMEVAPGYQLQASDLPDGFVYAFKADDQADIDAASPGEAVWVTLSPRG